MSLAGAGNPPAMTNPTNTTSPGVETGKTALQGVSDLQTPKQSPACRMFNSLSSVMMPHLASHVSTHVFICLIPEICYCQHSDAVHERFQANIKLRETPQKSIKILFASGCYRVARTRLLGKPASNGTRFAMAIVQARNHEHACQRLRGLSDPGSP